MPALMRIETTAAPDRYPLNGPLLAPPAGAAPRATEKHTSRARSLWWPSAGSLSPWVAEVSAAIAAPTPDTNRCHETADSQADRLAAWRSSGRAM